MAYTTKIGSNVTVKFIEQETFTAKFKVIDFIPKVTTLSHLNDVDINGSLSSEYVLGYDGANDVWKEKRLDSLIKQQTVFNETANRISSIRFSTANEFITGTLQVFLNGIKEINITEVGNQQFEFGQEVDNDWQITVHYIKK